MFGTQSAKPSPSMDDEEAQPLTCAVCDEPRIPHESLRDGWEWVQKQPHDLLDLVYKHLDYTYTPCRAHHVHNDVCDRFICSACYAKSSCECGKFIRCNAHIQKCSGCKKVVCNDGTLAGGCAKKCIDLHCGYLFCTQCRDSYKCSRCTLIACHRHMPKCVEGENMCYQCLSGNCYSCTRLVCFFHSAPCLAPTCQSISCSGCVKGCSHCQGSFCSIHMNKCAKDGCNNLLGVETTCLIASQCTCCGKYFCTSHQGYNHTC